MRSIVIAGMGVVIMMSTGCVSYVAKTGLKVVKGVDADVSPIRDISAGQLAGYNTLKLGDVTTDVGRICPHEVIQEIRRTAPREFAENTGKRFAGGAKILKADIVVRFYKKRGRIGGEGRLDLLVTLVDDASGQEIARLYVEGISESPLHTGIDDMVKKTTGALAKYLEHRKKG